MATPDLLERFDALLIFLPRFESKESPGEWRGGERGIDGVFVAPWFDPSELLLSFVKACETGGWVLPGFDWMTWRDDHAGEQDSDLAASADIPTLKQLLTSFVRAERFGEGHLAAAAESGSITAILRRVRELREDAGQVVSPNIFQIMESVSARTEPYHSAFLAAMLRWSLRKDRRFFDAFWHRAAPPAWSLPTSEVTVLTEDVVVTGRVDIVLLIGGEQVLGVEVKTRESSTSPGQLDRYREGLRDKYPGQDLAIAFLTPFDRGRAGDAAPTLQSIKEFDEFASNFPQCRHLSWLDLAEVDWDGGDLWAQHRRYVRTTISSEQRRLAWAQSSRTRELADFFGADAAERFDQQLAAMVGELNRHHLDVSRVQDPAAFAAIFRILIESEPVSGASGKPDAFDEVSRKPFLEGAAGAVHGALFDLAAENSSVWLEGKVNYGLRVAHPNHAGGVSLATSRGPDRLEIGQPR